MTPTLAIDGRRATILLDAPERRNALGRGDLRALAEIIDEVERDLRIEVAIVRATGNTFCAGYDLNELRADAGRASAGSAQVPFAHVADALETLRVPTICALDGGAYGGGSDIALACDIRVGTLQTRIAVPAAQFGLQFYYGGLRRCVERLGVDTAKRIFILAQTIEAPELFRLGFLHELVDTSYLEARIEEISTRILANVPTAVRGLKRSLNAIARGVADAEIIENAFAASLADVEVLARLSR